MDPLVPPPAPAVHGQPGHVCDPLCPSYRNEGAGWGAWPLGPDGYRRQLRVASFPYLAALDRRVLVFDGGLGTEIATFGLTTADYGGPRTEGCPEWLLATRPDVIAAIHRHYLEAGADVIETDSFGCLPQVLAEYGLADHAYGLALSAARIARLAADAAATPEQPRFVAGALGPGTRLLSLGHIAWDDLFAGYVMAARGLIAGGVDLVLIETCQDLLHLRCAVLACREAMRCEARELPIQAQVTVETSGTLLTGSDVTTALCVLEGLPVDVIGLNCATGPDLMEPHIRRFCHKSSRFVSCLPNAGLPRNVGGKAVFDLAPDQFATALVRFVRDVGLDACGGCCGTTPEHIRALVSALSGVHPDRRRADRRDDQVCGLYTTVDLRQEAGVLIVGERTNATGSKKFRDLLAAGDLDGMVALAQEQAAEGAHVLDVSVAATGRDERADLAAFLTRLRTAVEMPIMIDSTDPRAIETALTLLPGRPVINSVNFEDGTGRFDAVCSQARMHGAALVALVIDEDPQEPMAKTAARKIAVAERMYRRITEVHGIAPERILFDLLTFTIAQGDEASRHLGIETLDAIQALARRFPRCGFVLGLSNISFGLANEARRALNAVFLDEAVQRGLTAAILNAGKIVPVSALSQEDLSVARDLVFDQRRPGHDPLLILVNRFAQRSPKAEASTTADLPPETRLHRRILAGRKTGAEADLEALLAAGRPAEAILAEILLPAMREVGVLFGAGKMQLPFVLAAAECMKRCVDHLAPLLAKGAGHERGTVVLATVRGDVHDIGKNLAGIVLANNGYRVVDLGIRVNVERLEAAVREHRPLALGLSGLLVKSTEVMREDLATLRDRGIRCPILVGGAALNTEFAHRELRRAYASADTDPDQAPVFHAADAFAGLRILDALSAPDGAIALPTSAPAGPPTRCCGHGQACAVSSAPEAREVDVPAAPTGGTQAPYCFEASTVLDAIRPGGLFQGRWGFRAKDRDTAQRHFDRLRSRVLAQRLLEPAALIGFFGCRREGDGVVILDPATGAEAGRLDFPRQTGGEGRSLADWFRRDDDVLALQAVSVGQRILDAAAALNAEGAYQEYLFLHGLAVEAAEALAELTHQEAARRWGLPAGRGVRFSCGYPSWPDLTQQRILDRLLGFAQIHLSVSETCTLVPEAATTALIVHHPDARYF